MSFLIEAASAVINAVSGIFATAGSVITTVAGTAGGRSISGVLASIGLSLLSDTLLKQKGARPGALGEDVGFTSLIRAGTDPHRIIYGERMASGVLTYITTTGANNSLLHLVISISGTQIEALGGSASQTEDLQIFIDDEVIGTLDGSNIVNSGTFSGLVRINRHFGEHEQAADADLVAESSEWTTDHKLQGRGYLYVRLKNDPDAFPNGTPNIRLLVKGRKLWDPRIATISVTSSSVATKSLITTGAVHGLAIGDSIFLLGHTGGIINNDTTILFSGEFPVLTVPSTTTFTIPANVTTGGTGGTIVKMRWSNNAALCVADYLVAEHGLRIDPDFEIDVADLIAAANICDEQVNYPSTTPTFKFTVDSLADDRLLQTVGAGFAPDRLINLDAVQFTTTGTLPAGITLATTFFVLVLSPTKFHIFDSLAKALGGLIVDQIDITDVGTGIHTLARKQQPRYTVNAIISRQELAIDVIPKMLKAMFGSLTYSQGEYHTFAGAFSGPVTVTVTDDFLRAPVQVTPRPGIRNRFNGVKGTFIDLETGFQAVSIIAVQDPAARTADGQELFLDVELPYVTDNMRAQRILQLILKRGRSGRVAELRCNMKAQRIAPHDVIALTIDLMGFLDKEFEVLTRTLAPNGLGIDLTVKEIFASDFTVVADTDITVPGLPTPVPLPPAAASPPTNLALTSGTAELLAPTDGTIISRIKVTWTDAVDHTVLGYDVEFKKSADTDFLNAPFTRQGVGVTFIEGVADGVAYDVRIRSTTRQARRSAYVSVLAHTVIGKTAPPADVTGFQVQQNGILVTFKWNQVPDVDLAGYEIRFNQSASFVWESATPATEVTRGTLVTNTAIPPSEVEYTVGIKAIDTSDNESVTEATSNIIVVNNNTIVLFRKEQPRWQGATITNFIRHDVSGAIVPDDQDIPSGNDFIVFDTFIVNPVASALYEAKELDLGFDSDGIRAFAEVVSALGPGETIGIADPQLAIDFKDGAASYDGFEDWIIGTINARQVKMKLTLTLSKGKAFISQFIPTLDVSKRTEEDENVTIAIGGTAIVFTQIFNLKPNVQVTADGTTALFPIKSAVTTTGFSIKVFNSAGADVGGVVDWMATGA